MVDVSDHFGSRSPVSPNIIFANKCCTSAAQLSLEFDSTIRLYIPRPDVVFQLAVSSIILSSRVSDYYYVDRSQEGGVRKTKLHTPMP